LFFLAPFSSIVIALLLAEGILRLFPGILGEELRQIIGANYGIADPYIGHLGSPNNALVISGRGFSAVHHTDSYGFRNGSPWSERAEIVTLGDSWTYGYGVEDDGAWPAILARAFPQSRIINLGIPGYGPQQYLRVYERFGVKLRPKIVLVGFFTGNDFSDAEIFDGWLKSGTGGNDAVWREFGRPTSVSLSLRQPIRNIVSSLYWRGKVLAAKSSLGNLLIYSWHRLTWPAPSGMRIFHAPDGTPLELWTWDYRSRAKVARSGNHAFGLVVDALQRIDSLAKENGAVALIVLQHSKEEVYLPLLSEPSPDLSAPLRAALRERGIAYIDLLDEFRRHAAKGEVLFFETDSHPNARGYALIAELVITHLKQHAKRYGL
jgi:lysophospholipase L1-like esterase